MIDINLTVAKAIAASLQEFPLEERAVYDLLEKPKEQSHGDVCFPCFSLAKQLKQSPQNIAQGIVTVLQVNSVEGVEKVVAMGPYVNLFFDKKRVTEQILKTFLQKPDEYGKNNSGKEKPIIVEYSSANIAKSFGIGHLRSTVIGNSLANIYEANGHTVTRINYLGDWGTQFGKLIYGYQKWGNKESLQKNPIEHLQEVYIKTNKEMTDDIENESRDIFRRLEEGDENLVQLWNEFREVSIKDFDKVYELLGVKFDVISGESKQIERAKEVIKVLIDKNIATESDGAIIVDLEEEGNGIALLQKQDGSTIYVSRDIAAAITRKEEFNFHKMLYEVGSEQRLHFNQLFSILKKLGYEWADDCEHISHGLYLGKDGKKMSTRKGTSGKMMDIWDDVRESVQQEIRKRDDSLEKNEFEKRTNAITRAAVVYGDLSNYRQNNVIYDVEKITSMDGDSGPYLLYSYARSKSILRKINYERQQSPVQSAVDDEEYILIKKFSDFGQVVLDARRKNDPSQIANYSLELAKQFNTFYSKCKVVGSTKEEFRGQLVDMYGVILANCLRLLGIEPLEVM